MAQLHVSDAELAKLTTDISAVLDYAESIKQVVAQQQSALPVQQNVFREDVAHVCNGEKILAGAPEREDSLIVVPRIIKQS